MAVTFRSASPVFNTLGTSPTATEPTGAASGDYLVALYLTETTTANPTLPASWATLYARFTVGTSFQAIVGGFPRGGSAPSYAFTHTGSVYRELYVLCFQGASAVALDSQSASGSTGVAIAHNPDPPATTAVQATSLAVAMAINFGGSAVAWVAPSGYAIRSDNSTGNDSVLASKSLAASGSENPGAFTGEISTGSQAFWDGATITLEDVTSAATAKVAYQPAYLWAPLRAQ